MIRPAALCLSVAAPAWAQDCAALELPAGAERELPGEPPACYELSLDPGQRARVQVVDGPDALFDVDGVVERQEDYAFVSEGGPLRVRVTSDSGAPFVLRVALGAPREASGAWRVEEGEDRVLGRAWLAAEGGASLALACIAGEPGATLTYDGTGTAALMREGEEAQGAVEVVVGGETRRHPVTLLRIDGFDPYWEVRDGLGGAMLDDFAAGSTLRLLDGEGSVAGRVDLAGSARLRDSIARRCGL
jgi:hypothetical protein